MSSIYNHFPSKEAILSYILDEYTEYINGRTPQNTNLDEWISQNRNKKITAEMLYPLMFSNFPDERAERLRKMLKIFHYESINNERINAYMEYDTIESSVVFLRNTFEKLIDAEMLEPFDASTIACLLYSIILAYVNLSTRELNHMDRSGGQQSMDDMLYYVLNIVVEGNA